MGTCSNCKKRREVFSVSRQGGGNYRRAQRSYSSSICMDCAVAALDYARPARGVTTSSGYSISGLASAVRHSVDPDSDLYREDAVVAYSDYLDHLSIQVQENGSEHSRTHLARLVAEANNPAVDPTNRPLRTYTVKMDSTYASNDRDVRAHTVRQAIQRATGRVVGDLDEPVRDGDEWVLTYTAGIDTGTVRWPAD